MAFAMVLSFAYPKALNAVTLPEVVGMDISAFSSQTIDGSPVNGRVFDGKDITILHYFATWSADCIREIKYMQQAFESYAGNINVLGILHQDGTSTPQKAMQLFDEYGIEYQCILPDSVLTELITQYNFIPQTFFVSSRGIVLEHFPGTFTGYDSIEQRIEYWMGSSGQVYTIEFRDGLTGLYISQQSVVVGGDAIPPDPPVHPGYTFDGWRGNYNNVSSSGVVLAMYQNSGAAPELGDVDVDGRITITDALITARFALQLIESPSTELYGDMDDDGMIGITDALIIVRKALQLIP